LRTPINIAVDADGTRYVTDSGRQRVLVFGPDEVFRAEIGSDKDAMKPTGVAVTADRLLVSDLNAHCVRVYGKAGYQPLFTIPRDPKADQPGKLFMPVNLAVDTKGQVYVCDLAACEVQVYDAEGKHLRTIGSRGDALGQFARPKGIAVDRAGRVFVVDAATQVCQIFDADGKLLLFFGEPGQSAGALGLPAGICVEEKNLAFFQKFAAPDFVVEELVLIANQYGPNKVTVYGLGHKK
jgi:DNA-binding beta-propeller fold protein YncE